jgi:hypothetical protein
MAKAILEYLLSTIRHKLFVLYAGLFIVKKIPIHILLIHDWSKFLPIEFVNYAKYYKMGRENKEAFLKAWLHHQNTQKHHLEYWVSNGIDDWLNCPIPMPEVYVREMIADLLGASREYTNSWDMSEWLQLNMKGWRYAKDVTYQRLAKILNELGYYSVSFYCSNGSSALLWDPKIESKPFGAKR